MADTDTTKTQMIRPTDTGRALVNPGMGWVFHYYDNHIAKYGSRLASSDTLDDFPGLTTIYLRLAWSHLEPREGEYHWSLLDAVAQRWIDKGLRIALRLTCSESSPGEGTPLWVRDAGANGYLWTAGKGVDPQGQRWEPDYNDPVFLAKLSNFLGAVATRYDGDPAVEFIDVGSFGIWGEGHTYWSTRLTYDADTIIRHIDLHREHFKRSPLVANWTWTDHGRGMRSLDYSAAEGLWFRTDSILVMHGDLLYHPEHAEPFWRERPVVIESQHYGESVRDGVWGDGSGYLQAIEEYHGSYASIHWWPREFHEGCRDPIDRINLRLGYRVRTTEVAWTATTTMRGGSIDFRSRWQNAGVAPCLPGGHPAYTLKDAAGGIVAVFVDDGFDVRTLPVGPAGDVPSVERSRRWPVPETLPAGEYRLFVSVGSPTGTPKIALPHDREDGTRRHELGRVVVTEP